jgi:peptide subunit release factor RF-3
MLDGSCDLCDVVVHNTPVFFHAALNNNFDGGVVLLVLCVVRHAPDPRSQTRRPAASWEAERI